MAGGAVGNRRGPLAALAGRRGALYGAAGLAVVVLFHLLVSSGYLLDIADDMIIWAILTIGLNVVVGFAGLLDLGYIAFFAIGGYTFGVLGSKLGVSMWASIPIAAVLVLVASVIIGIPTLRLKSDYLAIMTLGFGEIIYLTVNNLNAMTGGPNGLYNMPAPRFFGITLEQPGQFYWFLAILLALTLLVVARLKGSHVGRAWLAVRQDELAARATGVDVVRYKLLAYMVGALWAGIVGVLFAAKQTIVSPTSFQFSQSFYVLSSVIIGGMGSIAGAVAGGFLFIIISESLQGLAQSYSSVVFSLALLAVILLRPSGILPALGAEPRAALRNRGRGTLRQASADGPLPAAERVPGAGNGSLAAGGSLPAAEQVSRAAGRPAPSDAGAAVAPLLEVTGVTVSFGGVHAVRDLSLSVRPAEIVAVIGPNGAGKTSLLNLISGFARPESGRILLAGREVTRVRPDLRAAMGIARTFQTPRLLPTVTVLENVMQGAHVTFRSGVLPVAFAMRAQRRHEKLAREEALELLAAVGLSDAADRIPTQLSYGDQRRCEIARCLALHPRVILLDEPAAGMNATETAALGDLVLRIRELGIAVLLVDHDMTLVRKVSDRVVAMDRGAEVVSGDVESVLRHPEVVQSYLGA